MHADLIMKVSSSFEAMNISLLGTENFIHVQLYSSIDLPILMEIEVEAEEEEEEDSEEVVCIEISGQEPL